VVESLKRAVSWLVVFAVGLAPMLVYWVAGVIGRAFRRKGGGVRRDVAGRSRARAGKRERVPAPARLLRRVSRRHNPNPVPRAETGGDNRATAECSNSPKSASNLI
jgi:hypothetical protein